MIPARKGSLNWTAKDPRTEMKEVSGLRNLDSAFILSIFLLKLPTFNLNATGSIGSTSKMYRM